MRIKGRNREKVFTFVHVNSKVSNAYLSKDKNLPGFQQVDLIKILILFFRKKSKFND